MNNQFLLFRFRVGLDRRASRLFVGGSASARVGVAALETAIEPYLLRKFASLKRYPLILQLLIKEVDGARG